MYKDAIIMRDYRNLKSLRAKRRKIKAEMRRKEIQLDKLNERIELAEATTEIYKGIPLHLSEYFGWSLSHADRFYSNRRADVYRNARNSSFYGLNFHSLEERWYGGKNIGFWFSEDWAKTAAREFVAFGIIPDKEEVERLRQAALKEGF